MQRDSGNLHSLYPRITTLYHSAWPPGLPSPSPPFTIISHAQVQRHSFVLRAGSHCDIGRVLWPNMYILAKSIRKAREQAQMHISVTCNPAGSPNLQAPYPKHSVQGAQLPQTTERVTDPGWFQNLRGSQYDSNYRAAAPPCFMSPPVHRISLSLLQFPGPQNQVPQHLDRRK